MAQTAHMRSALDTMQEEILTMYKALRCGEAKMIMQLCGIPITFDLWSHEQCKDITTALNRGNGGRVAQALERFGYHKTRTTTKGISFRHQLLPELYAPLIVTNGADIFKEWPADLINQIYLNDVVLYKQNMIAKARTTRILNGTTTSRKRVRDESLSDERCRRVRAEERKEGTDEYSRI